LRLVLLSDTHGSHPQLSLPSGDVLVHAGDFSRYRDGWAELGSFCDWLRAQPHRHKVLVAGNHDFCFERHGAEARRFTSGIHYLEDEGVELDGLRFYGSPWQPTFFNWAFNLPRGAALAEKWGRIPASTDVLVTHGPPLGILDRVHDGQRVGCADLLSAVERVAPLLHTFGHIHESGGVEQRGEQRFVNASVFDGRGGLRAPTVVDL